MEKSANPNTPSSQHSTTPPSSMVRSTGALGAATMASRVLGLVREMVYASFMGQGGVASAFFIAFTIPNLLRRLLGEGALSAAFVPVFTDRLQRDGRAAAWRAANSVASVLAVGLVGVTVLAVIVLGMLLTVSPDRAQAMIAAAWVVLRRWEAERVCGEEHIRRWSEILDRPLKDLALMLGDELDGWGVALRQRSPWFEAGSDPASNVAPDAAAPAGRVPAASAAARTQIAPIPEK